VYALPFANPVTTHDATPDVEHVCPPGEAVTTYPEMAAPPVIAGGVQLTLAAPFPRVTETLDGGSGTVAGVTAFDDDDSTLLPTAFVAWTVNVYSVPFVKLVTVHDVVPVAEQVEPPGEAVTV